MKCQNCRLNLTCLMGKLGGVLGYVNLCPTCGRLQVVPSSIDDGNIYILHCEQRTLTSSIRQMYSRALPIRSLGDPEERLRRYATTSDTGPGLPRALVICKCILCDHTTRNLPELKIVDLDEEEKNERDFAPHVFKLR